MANTYESKFKGVEVDEGVNIARNLAGTGGIDIRTLGTGINTVKTIDGSILMTALGEKQDTLTVSSNVHINSLTAEYITLGSSGSISLYPQSGASGNAYLPKYGGYLATTGDIPAVVPITGTGTTTVMSQKAVTDELGKKQDKITDQTSLNVGALTAKGYSSLNGIFVDNSTTKPICFKRNGSIVTKMYGPTSGGGELVNVYLPGKGGTLATTDDIPTGGGNINLYRHTVKITQGTTGSQNMIYTTLYSSNNTPIGSLADLKTMLNLSASETYPAYGTVSSGQAVLYLQKVGANLSVNYMTGSMTSQTLSSGRVDDWVKTI